MELLINLLTEDLLWKYIFFKLLYLIPYFTAFLFLLIHTIARVKVSAEWIEVRKIKHKVTHTCLLISKTLIWRIKCLSRQSDEVAASPIY
ncbi:hypothetical protein [Macrococcoides canis]|uniref:hypothetical protein n=1 Tax=Macrococcoides canis TaxID=1855823 RepID=UPI001AEBE44F|nr:hypothetical protein [Macrococcus canis]QTQ07765.1 hypothetical protein J9174_10255 [Macrococcus canis]QUR94976.1 hypothetical protein GOY09_08425 [Macrococcus canis]UTH02071.1 hypothetical protein KFV05_10340 [Macrococcus canis]UTH06509.1 hypothetical protein KFV07_10230 [Macrococcus canis]